MRLGLIVTQGALPYVVPTPDPTSSEHDKLNFKPDKFGKLTVYTEDAFGQEYPIAFYSEDLGKWERENKSYDKIVVVT